MNLTARSLYLFLQWEIRKFIGEFRDNKTYQGKELTQTVKK